ncbi:MAG: glycoside hydrolase family 9 protein, partial [Planctomycetes bacterium]|nr:glycoside hydrolase family 9 protein [Planctomycetota bacterium]
MRVMSVVFVCLILSSYANAADYFVDLSKQVNTALEDDGISNNNAGGWSDEGINDMYIYPAVAKGKFTRNGHSFQMTDDNSVIMLKGKQRGKEKPQSVTCAVDQQTAQYIYVLQNSVGSAGSQEKNYTAAQYILKYADGTAHSFAIRDGIELQPWWCAQWYHNAEAASWPIFMGRNYYSMKWKRFIGVWSCQLKNPHPEKKISAIELQSQALATPVIFAITLSNVNWADEQENLNKKQYFKTPEMPNATYFKDKVDQERRGVFTCAVQEGLLKGLCDVYAIRDDLVAVHVDNAFAEIGVGSGAGRIEALQKAENFQLTNAAGTVLEIDKVGRQSYEAWVGNIGPYPANKLFTHVFYLHLKNPLSEGAKCSVKVQQLASEFTSEKQFTFSQTTNPSPAIKVNQVAYAASSQQRFAYLAWWAGDSGTVSFADCRDYYIVDGETGAQVSKGQTQLRGTSETSGEEVFEIDLSQLAANKKYRIAVPKVGSSADFYIGGVGSRSLYYDTSRAFYHQRAGCELTQKHTDFPRSASHLKVYESGYMVSNSSYKAKSGEKIKEFHGGYHDAGDDDVFTYHLQATYQLLSIYDLAKDSFIDGDLNIPKSGNGIPDVLDEAQWALFFFADHIAADGKVPLGRGHDQDYIRGYEKKHGKRPSFGILPGYNSSNAEFAAVAAQYARLIKIYDEKEAQKYTQVAIKAYAWLAQQTLNESDNREKLFRMWAAAELYHLTGQTHYHDAFQKMHADEYATRSHWKASFYKPMIAWSYLALPADKQDADIKAAMHKILFDHVASVLTLTDKNAYRWGW